MKGSLISQRLLEVIERFPGAEVIDKLTLSEEQNSSEKGDFFLQGRQVIGEIKAVETDTTPKIDAVLEPHRQRADWPIFYGTWPLANVLSHLPDGDTIGKKIADAVTSGIAEAIRKANRQIRETKKAFELPESEGLVVLLNETVEILDIRQMSQAVLLNLRKKTPLGELQFPEITAVLVVDEAHVIPAGPLLFRPTAVIPNVMATGNTSAMKAAHELVKRWAAVGGHPVVGLPGATYESARVVSASEVGAPAQSLKRSDWWRQRYRGNRYLGALSEPELLRHGVKSFERLAPTFLKGGPQPSEKDQQELLEHWTHFLEEMNLRGLDMRQFGQVLDDTGATRLIRESAEAPEKRD